MMALHTLIIARCLREIRGRSSRYRRGISRILRERLNDRVTPLCRRVYPRRAVCGTRSAIGRRRV